MDRAVALVPDWTDRARSLLGAWGLPPDGPAKVAAAIAVGFALLALGRRHAWLARGRTRVVVAALALAATVLSLVYQAHYLRGGPRIVDATTYWLQARALSHGHFAWAVPEPSASFRGRFLLDHDGRLAGIFPPGWPLLLSLGFLVGAPMLVGPMLAGALVMATWALARELAHGHPEAATIARLAAALSVACAALRYHTADTMSHGATALWVTTSLTAALVARRKTDPRWLAASGLALGMVAATRPVSALPVGACVALLAFYTHRAWPLRLAAFALPGVALLLLAQWASTGSALGSTQLAYYATSDGPPGCFRYGFGAGIGCLFEHGDFVRARLPDGYGALAAAGTTVRRLQLHLSDATNAWPLGLALLALAPRAVRSAPRLRWVAALVALHVVAYAPFYFDGNYPGGGARLFADVLPAEHALAAIAVASAFRASYTRIAAASLALVMAGFALHAAFDHRLLAEREEGRPMFEPAVLASAGVTSGVVFMDTDHGFDLAHDPGSSALVFARRRGDDHDRLLLARLGATRAWAYHHGATPTLTPWEPSSQDAGAWTFEAEADWPPLAQRGGAWAEPIWASGTCASAGRALEVHGAGSVTIALPVPVRGRWKVRPSLLARGGPGSLVVADTSWTWGPLEAGTGAPEFCRALEVRVVSLDADEVPVTLVSDGAGATLDAIRLEAP